MPQTYYDILGVEPTADAAAIRKAYLKLSLQHHPDKNPHDVEASKARFIAVGTAYETLKDESKRAAYDRALRSGQFSMPSNHNTEQAYTKFSDFFDETVASMTPEQFAAAMAGASIVGSLVGSMVGNRLMGNQSNSFLRSAGSMVGSLVASEMATSSVAALHQQSVQRIQYKQACQRAVERGEPMPEPPKASKWEEILGQTMERVQNLQRSGAAGNLWKKAAAGVSQMAAQAKQNSPSSTTPYR